MKKRDFQFVAAYAIALFGLALITTALFLPPTGEIHPSVLAAFGEILTFAGASIGMDYHYRSRYNSRESKDESREKFDIEKFREQ